MRHYTVSEEQSGQRLDQFIHQEKSDLTRTFIQKLIKEGCVFVNHKKVTKSGFKMKSQDAVVVQIPSIKEIGILPEDIPLQVIHEDEDILVVNKAPGMVVHPTDHGAHVSGTLVNAVMFHCQDLSGMGGEKRPGIVHRLDKDTSGLIIVAKNDHAHHFVAKQIQERKVVKRYIALLKGHVEPQQGSIEAPLIKSQAGGRADVQISGNAKAKYALTHYQVIRYLKDFTLVSIQIITGRTHQIRVHFAAIGHPVCGDALYGDAQFNQKLEKMGLKRQFLHAAELEFKLPSNKNTIHLKAPLAEDLEAVLKNLES